MIDVDLAQFQAQRRALQRMIDETTPNGRLILPPGEHPGPLVFTKPMTVLGQGDESVIWVPEGPVLVIDSPNVHLINVSLEQTIRSDSAEILYQRDCQPVQEQVASFHLRSAEMNPAQLIDLGTLVVGKSLRIPFDFPAPGGAITPDKNGLFELEPTAPHQGRFTKAVWITVRPPSEGGFMLGIMRVRSADRVEPLDYVVRARVTQEAPEAGPLFLRGKQRQFFFERWLTLGTEQFQIMTKSSEIINSQIVILRKDNFHWLWVPSLIPDKESIELDSESLRAWTLRLLHAGQKLRINGMQLTLDQSKPFSLALPRELAFGKIESIAPKEMKIPLTKPGATHISGGWDGHVKSTVPWLTVRDPDIRIGRGKASGEISVTLEPGNLPNGSYWEPSGIALFTDKEIMFVEISATLDVPPYQPVVPAEVRFAPPAGESYYDGELAGLTSKMVLGNRGPLELNLDVSSCPDWLDLSGTCFLVPGKTSIDVTVTLNKRANSAIKPGIKPSEIVLECRETKEKFKVAIIVVVTPANVDIQVEYVRPAKFQYDLEDEYTPALSTNVGLINKGNVVGVFTFEPSNKDALQLGPLPEKLAPYSATIDFVVNIPTEWLQSQKEGDIAKLELKLFAGRTEQLLKEITTITIEVVFVRRRPGVGDIIIEPASVEIGELVAGDIPDFSQKFLIRNNGEGVFKGELLVDVNWLGIKPDGKLRLGSRREEIITSHILPAIRNLAPGTHQATIKALGAPNPAEATVNVDVEPFEPYLVKETEFLWFGALEKGILEFPTETLRLGNHGHRAWSAKVMSIASWLDAPVKAGDRIVIPKLHRLRLPVAVNAQVFALGLGPHTVERAIVISDDHNRQIEVMARILITAPRAHMALSPTSVDFGVLTVGQIPYASREVKQKTIEIKNSGTKDWLVQGVETPSWLMVDEKLHEGTVIPPGGAATFNIVLQPRVDLSDQSAKHSNEQNEELGEQSNEIVITSEDTPPLILNCKLKLVPSNLEITPLISLEKVGRFTIPPKTTAKTTILTIKNNGAATFYLQPITEDKRDGNVKLVQYIDLIDVKTGDELRHECISLAPNEERTWNARISEGAQRAGIISSITIESSEREKPYTIVVRT